MNETYSFPPGSLTELARGKEYQHACRDRQTVIGFNKPHGMFLPFSGKKGAGRY